MADGIVNDSQSMRGWLSTQNPPKACVKHGSKRIIRSNSRQPILRQTQLQAKKRESTLLTMAELDVLQPSHAAAKQSSLLTYFSSSDLTCGNDPPIHSEVSKHQDTNQQNKLDVQITNTIKSGNKRLRISSCDESDINDLSICGEEGINSTSIVEKDLNISACGSEHLGFDKQINSEKEIEVSGSLDLINFSKMNELPSSGFHKDNPNLTRRTLSLKSGNPITRGMDNDFHSDKNTSLDIDNNFDKKSMLKKNEDCSFSLLQTNSLSIGSEFSKIPDGSGTLDLTLEECANTDHKETQVREVTLTSALDTYSFNSRSENDMFSSLSGETLSEQCCSLRETEKLSKEKYKLMMGTLTFSDLDSFSS